MSAQLLRFARRTLELMEQSEEWDADLTDAIAGEAQSLGLAKLNAHGYFTRTTDDESKEPPTLAVILEGGICQGVVSDQPDAFHWVNVLVLDYDTDGADHEDRAKRCRYVPQSDGSHSLAYVQSIAPVGKAHGENGGLLGMVEPDEVEGIDTSDDGYIPHTVLNRPRTLARIQAAIRSAEGAMRHACRKQDLALHS